MPKHDHHKAAAHHDEAAKSHRNAAEAHEKGNEADASQHSQLAHDHSTQAHEASQSAHSKTKGPKKPLQAIAHHGLCIPLGCCRVSRTPIVTAHGTTGDEDVRSLSIPGVTLIG